jgi:DNA-binding transcriptional ArsR family regulator
MEELPDELRTKAPAEKPGFRRLADFLWETASWDPVVERLVNESVHNGTEPELVTVGRRLLHERRLTEPSRIARLVQLLAVVGELDPGQLSGANDGVVAGPPLPPDLDPLGSALPLLGRETELAVASRGRDRWPNGVSVVCVTGPAGAGKTRLGREIAAALDRSQESRLLRAKLSWRAPGTEDHMHPTTPYEALAELLPQLGVPAAEIPATLDGRRARFAAELTDRYPIILLDGVVHEDQVRPLLPPRRGAVVLTSRSPLTGLNDHSAQFVWLGRLSGDWPRRLVRRVFQTHGVEPDNSATAAIARWSDGLPGPAILLARWAAVTAREEGLAPDAVARRLESAPDADKTAAAVGLLDDDQQAVLRTMAVLRLPRADQWALSLSTGLDQNRVATALTRLAELGLVCADERDSTWIIDPHAADRVQTRAIATGQLTSACYEQLTGPLIGLYTLRAQALLNLMADTAPQAGAAVQAWALRQWQTERPGLDSILEAAAAAPRPALGLPLATAVMDAADVDRAGDGGYESEASVTAVARIAQDAVDQRLEDRAQTWLVRQDRLRGAAGQATFRETADPPEPQADSVPPDGPPVERLALAELNAVPSGPLLFGAGGPGQ